MESRALWGLCCRGAFRADCRQRTAHPQRAGAQNRCEGFRVDRRSGAARPNRQELRAASAAAGTARASPLSAQGGGEPGGRTQPAPEALGNRQHQAGERRFRRFRRVRPRDAPGADRGRGLGRGDGRSRQGAIAPQARRSDPGARRADGGPTASCWRCNCGASKPPNRILRPSTNASPSSSKPIVSSMPCSC